MDSLWHSMLSMEKDLTLPRQLPKHSRKIMILQDVAERQECSQAYKKLQWNSCGFKVSYSLKLFTQSHLQWESIGRWGYWCVTRIHCTFSQLLVGFSFFHPSPSSFFHHFNFLTLDERLLFVCWFVCFENNMEGKGNRSQNKVRCQKGEYIIIRLLLDNLGNELLGKH